MEGPTLRALVLATIFGLSIAAGCLSSGTDDEEGPAADAWGYTPVRERHTLGFNVTDRWSHTLEGGPYTLKEILEADVEFDQPLGKGLPTATVNMGIFLPDVPEGTKVPVVADVGPYYYDLDRGATDPTTQRLGGFLIENLVQHGFAVAQVSVPGTGKSGGCMDLMGLVEQAGIDAAVEYLGTQPWSNGNVGLIGRSYDGSTPWEAATFGNPHLKTVVPISGLYGQHDLMWRNGSAETRGPGLLWGIYYLFTYTAPEHAVDVPWPEEVSDFFILGDPDELVPSPEYAPQHARNLAESAVCPETQTGAVQALAAYGTASRVAPQANSYWTDRSFKEEALANYQGSVYFIHGLQDWNVDPHMAFPFYNELEEAGLETKGLFGQWQHMYPDRPGEHDGMPAGEGREAYPGSVRWDWAQDLLEWFTYYLKEEGPKPQLHVEVQDNQGAWRIEETWPPADVAWTETTLGAFDVTGADGTLGPAVSPTHRFTLDLGETTQVTRLAGLPRLHVTATPTGPGGQIGVYLWDATDNIRLGHAVMDLRVANGGLDPEPVVPGMPLVARMEFEPLDVLIPAGHKLELRFQNTVEDYLPSTMSNPVRIDLEATTLKLPTLDRPAGHESFFTPPQWSPAKDP